MNKCIICGNPTELDSQHFCKKCLDTPIEVLQRKYEIKRPSETQQDQRKAQPTEDPYESCPLSFYYHRFGQGVKGILQRSGIFERS
jgi:hypothetical protein